MPAPIVGLDIGTAQIKAVELVASSKEGLTITNVAFMPTPVGLVQNNTLTDPILMGRVIKQMLKEGGIRAKRVVGSVAGQTSVVVRIIEVPKMSPTELAETMKWEVERHVSFAPNEVNMDYQVLPIQDASESNPNISVLLAAAQQDVVTGYVDMLFAAGLDPIAIDIEPLASGRALLDIVDGRPVVRATPNADNAYDLSNLNVQRETIAIVNIGATNTDVSIYEDGQLIFPRSLPIAGESLTRAVSEVLGYTMEQAERIKIDHATVIVERMGEYTGSFYGQPDEQQPMSFDYHEETVSSFEPSLADADLGAFRSPFDQTDDENTTQPPVPDFSDTTQPFESPSLQDPLDRTQPIPRKSLDLARHTPPTDFTGNFDLGTSIDSEEQRIQVFEAIAPVLAEMATELRRSLEYHRSRTRGRGVDKIMLCGGTANLKGLDQFLDTELQVPVVVANPLNGLNIATKQFDPSYLNSIAPIFTVAIGLAEREAVYHANPPDPALKAPLKIPGVSAGGGGGMGKFTSGFKLPFGKKTQGTSGAPVSE
jgi:type IV pilus assembly protein PilM